MKKNKPLEKHFYVPIANGVILGKRMTTACKQVLLVLELKAGQSRLAKISQKTIANQTGYSLRTVKRAYKHLKQNGRIEECSGGIHLREPYPKENYVQAYEGVVHHPKWYDWQKHVLLFILTQFRGSDSDSGNRRYSLNLRGEKGKSIERYCRVPGATAGTRRKAVRGFVQELEQLGVLKVVERASRGRPAICRISMEALASMPPERRRVRCQTDPRDGDRAIRALVTCGAVRGDKPVREMVTNHADDKDSTKTQPNSPQISKSPLPPSAAGGAISSKVEEIDIGEEDSSFFELAHRLASKEHMRLIWEVEKQCFGISLQNSHVNHDMLATRLTVVLEELPSDITSDDIVIAIRSLVNSGIRLSSWGLFLSDKFIHQFFQEIEYHHRDRKRLEKEEAESYQRTLKLLRDPSAKARKQALSDLVSRGNRHKEAPVYIVTVLIGNKRDADHEVRACAVKSLMHALNGNCVHPTLFPVIERAANAALTDPNRLVADEGYWLLSEIKRKQRENTNGSDRRKELESEATSEAQAASHRQWLLREQTRAR